MPPRESQPRRATPERPGGLWAYWRRVARFALLGHPPRAVWDVPTWGLCVPFRLWRLPVRYDGVTFEENYSPGLSPRARRLLPLRWLYLLFLVLWPWTAFLRALRPGRRGWRYFRGALRRPDLSVFFPRATFSERELDWSRPDHALGMFHACEYVRTRAAYFELDDKRAFHAACLRAGLPVPRRVSRNEALALGGEWMVKDPRGDLGHGVRRLQASALAALPQSEEVVIEEVLHNHPDLLVALPPTAPLCSFRVITTLDAASGEPRVSRCALRIGNAGAAADNTAQGGIWSQVDVESGAIRAGVKKKTFGKWQGEVPVRHGEHPDTGRSFVGLRIPRFEENVALALHAHRTLAPFALSLGWDVALAASGPALLEVNVWTVTYDYEPQTDQLTPSCQAILARLSWVAPR
jgi:hypothetical protein